MLRTEECSKCGSTEIIPKVHILDRMDGTDFDATALTVAVYDNPDAFLFRGKHTRTLNAWICGRCGYTELFVSNPEELLLAYKESQVKKHD